MKAIKCEMCNSNDVVKIDGVYVCQACGTKYSVDEAKKLMVEFSGKVSVDNTDKLENLFQLARRAKETDDVTGAAQYYEQIAMEDANSWEAAFYSVFYKCKSCKVGEIGNSIVLMNNSMGVVFDMVKDSDATDSEKIKCYNEMYSNVVQLAVLFNQNIVAYGTERTYSIWKNELFDLLMHLGDLIKDYAKDDNKANEAFKYVMQYSYNAGANLYPEARERATKKIQSIEPDYVPQKSSTEGCYIATAVYGSYDCPEVWTLRRYRDYDLAVTWYGRIFICAYYFISPILVRCFGRQNWFKIIFRRKLDLMVAKLQRKGYESTPYLDKEWK